ncbi:MAG: HdeD family acid-resistance protein [Bacteroidota bacterium]
MKKSRSDILKAVLFIIFGILILVNPGEALVLIAIYFGILAILAGIISFYKAWHYYQRSGQTSTGILEGIISLAIGILILTYPEHSVSLFMILFGIWAFIIGIIQLMAYRGFSELNIKSGSLLVSGILSILVALLMLLNPFISAGIIAVIIAVYAIIYGGALLVR